MKLLERLAQGPLVLDGSMSTPLEVAGAKTNSDLWTSQTLIDNPDLVYQVHLDYFKAGADLTITDTYQTNADALVRHGLSEEEARNLIKRAVQLANQARDDYEKETGKHNYVAGSIGPYGAYLADGSEYRGDYDLTAIQLQNFHLPRLAAILATGVDCLALETQPKLTEVVAILALLKTLEPTMPVYVSFSLRDAEHLSDGTSLKEAVQVVTKDPQVFAVGVNCVGLDLVTPAIKAIKEVTDKPVIVYPNSGATYDPTVKQWRFEEGTPRFVNAIDDWITAGAAIIGGCCTTLPQDIAVVAEKLRGVGNNR
ncbi:homocysteine S-methyltransferase [Limosilactobacillus fermentum]|uniref:homocysteine S-methyltransferase n=1 Tax=Limosilactobacillus fermentum TaxID=1613 RepID=UPI000F4E5F6F|nr:homocysteine S-methyltransferase [Limosilactobacillus fermentum]